MKKETQWTPAAVAAMQRGDFTNMIAAMTPGGIEAQEAAGQREFVQSQKLPKECPRGELETLGFVFGADVDDLFIAVTFPDGWSLKATDHSMWNELIDPHGRKRGSIFYKAAFYDRSANMYLSPAIRVEKRYFGGETTPETIDIAVVRGDEELFSTDMTLRFNWEAIEVLEKQARAWVEEHYPDFRDPLAYWNDSSPPAP